MTFEFKLPDIGEGVVEGEIVKWLVKPGDPISVDQPMVEVMTDKATVVIPSPVQGVVKETRGKEGDIAKVHAVLVIIEESAGSAAKVPASKTPPPAVASPVTSSVAQSVAAKPATPVASSVSASSYAPPSSGAQPASSAPSRGSSSMSMQGSGFAMNVATTPSMPPPVSAPRNGNGHGAGHSYTSPSKILAAPATRRMARELEIDLSAVPGSGPGGRVTSEDVKQVYRTRGLTARPAPIETPTQIPGRPLPEISQGGEADERIPIRGIRKRIYENMTISKSTAAHFTFVEECDVTELVALRERFNQQVGREEVKFTYLPFIVKAVVATLKRFPALNGHVNDANMEFIQKKDYHIGIAAASERGLIVPVLRNADRRSLRDISAEIARLGDAVRQNRTNTADLGGSTFTITSLGKDGGIFATPIINYPEVAIMGVHKISARPMVVEGNIVIRQMMNLSLSFDHRLIDGHIGAAFTYAVIGLLQNPDRLMMEMS